MRLKDLTFFKIFSWFLLWRVLLFLIAFLSIFFIPKYGGTFPYVERVLEITKLPNWIWGFGGFDGVHYLRIAQDGYKAAVYIPAFFPVFPLVIRYFAYLLPKDYSLIDIYVDPAFFYAGIFLSNIFFLMALFLLYKLFIIDFDKKNSKLALLFLLLFPTSFYFGSIYTESLFLLLTVITFYFARRRNFILAGVFASIASATRFAGIFLFPAILFELYLAIRNKEINPRNIKFLFSLIGVLISPLGLILYMFYLWREFSDPLYFISAQPYFGAQRSSTIILLPQVIYRYIKILLDIPLFSLQFFNSFLEFVFSLGAIAFLFLYFKKIRFSYWIFSFFSVITPTLTGSFSSMPRYVLQTFLIFPILVIAMGKYRILFFMFSFILGAILLALFVRGYWIA